jgi:hypothetical protein
VDAVAAAVVDIDIVDAPLVRVEEAAPSDKESLVMLAIAGNIKTDSPCIPVPNSSNCFETCKSSAR